MSATTMSPKAATPGAQPEAFNNDTAGAELSFAARLAADNPCYLPYANRVIKEYRR